MTGNNNLQIHILDKCIEQIQQHAEKTFPEECCGLLIGNYVDELPFVTQIKSMKNINKGSRKTRYDMDPLELVMVEDELDELGLQMIGIYHSHPNHPAKLSETDFNFAWPNISYTVISVQDGKSDLLTSWRLEMEGTKKIKFKEEKIVKIEE